MKHAALLRAALAAAQVVVLGACSELWPPVPVELVPEGEGSLLPPTPVTAPPTEPAETPDAAAGHPLPSAPPTVAPVDPDAPPTRPRRRMDIDQLDRAIRRVTGGIGWTEVRNGVEVNLFTELSATLGKADFVQITVDNLETSAIFQKFLGDAARSVCERRLQADLAAPADQERLLLPVAPGDLDPAGIDAHLVALRRTYHGVGMSPESPEMESWRWLYQSVLHVSGEPARGWNAVCVALLTHPDFYLY
ncbi:hypothetical protein L6V77_27495 [Myxococcota bacterium]|nr:hypothetical protein [Myxococcota bacterium]